MLLLAFALRFVTVFLSGKHEKALEEQGMAYSFLSRRFPDVFDASRRLHTCWTRVTCRPSLWCALLRVHVAYQTEISRGSDGAARQAVGPRLKA